MKKFAAITLMLVAISCRSSGKGQQDPSPTFRAQHEAGVASLRTSPTMADLVTIEEDLRELREIMRTESHGAADLARLEIMKGEAVLAAQSREDELRSARLAELEECLREIAKADALVARGADAEHVIKYLRSCVECSEGHQTEDFLLKTEEEAGRVRKAAKAAIARLCPTEG